MVPWIASWKATRARRAGDIDLTEADRLVAGDCPDPRRYGLGRLLDAASAPATGAELAGERQAVDRLVAARRAVLAASPVRRRHARVRPTARTVFVSLAMGLALLVVAGVAAETGSLPATWQQRAHDVFGLLGVPPPDTGDGGDGVPTGGAGATPTAPGNSPTPGRSPGADQPPAAPATPNPTGANARALCRAWNAAGRDPDGTGMNAPSWRALVAVAGGRARVPALCTALIGAPSAGTAAPTPTASRPDKSGAGPAPSSHPGGGSQRGRPTPGPGR